MQTIGLIGGMSWESSAIYYRLINEAMRDRLGALHSAKLLLWSAEFSDVAARQAKGEWDHLGHMLADAALTLERGGADVILICSNTMHKVADDVSRALSIPLVHIVSVTAEAIRNAGCRRPLLLATAFTMNDAFYRDHMQDKHDIVVLLPDDKDQLVVHDIIYNELCQGIVKPASKLRYMDIVRLAEERGADSIILGCTEIGLLLSQADFNLPVFDTTLLHAEAAVNHALSTHTPGYA